MLWHHDTQRNGMQHNDAQQKGLICDTQHKTPYHCAECRILFIVMVNVVMVNVVMVNVIMVNVIMVNVIMVNVIMMNVVMVTVLYSGL